VGFVVFSLNLATIPSSIQRPVQTSAADRLSRQALGQLNGRDPFASNGDQFIQLLDLIAESDRRGVVLEDASVPNCLHTPVTIAPATSFLAGSAPSAQRVSEDRSAHGDGRDAHGLAI
jgi:hypothetical protein